MMSKLQSDYNFIEKFKFMAESYPDFTAYEEEGTDIKYTYRECLRQIEVWKGYFAALDIKSGDKILIFLAEEIEFIFSFYALASTGVISAFYDTKATDYELNQIIEQFDPDGIVTSSKHFARRDQLLYNPGLRFVMTTDSFDDIRTDSIFEKIIFSDLPRSPIPLEAPERDTIISCHFTYKGFGYPLQVRHTYHEYALFLEQACTIYPQEPGSVNLIGLPFYPIYGISTSVVFPLSNGSKMLVCKDLPKKNILSLLANNDVTLVCLVPLLLKKLANEGALDNEGHKDKLDPRLEIISGGSYLNEGLQKAIYKSLGLKVYQGYGLTETFPITFNHKKKVCFGTIGSPISEYTTISIVNYDGILLPTGEVGEIMIKGKTIAEGYYGKKAETENFFQQGGIYTGDLGYLDQDGFLHFVGRKYPFTKVTSKMVDLSEIEQAVTNYSGVIEARAIVRENDKFGELVYLYVKVERQKQITEKDLKSHCRTFLSRHKVPSKIYVVN